MIITATPLRTSLLGGGTDLPEWFLRSRGFVVGSTINKYIYVILTKRFDNKIYVGYSKQEIVTSVNKIEHDLVREAAKMAGMKDGFEVKTTADIPSEGSGLGSSSALIVGLLRAFYEYRNISKESYKIAEEAFTIERTILKRPVGKQDHFFAAIGGRMRFEFDGNRVIGTPIELLDDNLYLFHTGVSRSSTPILEDQRTNINEYTEVIYKGMSDLARGFIYGKETLPQYIKANWELKKQLSTKIVTPEIETMCKLAVAGGSNAYKILGAGGGGFLLVHAENGKIDSVRQSLKDYKEIPFTFVDHGCRVIFNNEQ